MARTILITGASSGLGLDAARQLQAQGAHVITASRTPSPIGEHHHLDLANLASIQAFADTISTRPIDCLINNAGVLLPPPRLVHDSEVHLGINFLGHFALTKLLCESMPSLTRVVHITSMVAQFVRFKNRVELKGMRAYAVSKLATLMFALELSERDPKRRHIVCHPGYTATNIQANLRLGRLGNALLGQSVEQGVQSIIAAAEQDFSSGTFIGPKRLFELRGEPEHLNPYASALDRTAREALWQMAESRLNLQFTL